MMNEPTEHAQKTTGPVTAGALLAVLRNCASASLHGTAAPDRAEWSDSFTFRMVARFERKGVTSQKEIHVPGWVSNGRTDDPEIVHRPRAGFWWLYAVTDRLVDALELLPADAQIAFHVYLDAGTTEALRRAQLHGDRLTLHAHYSRRGKTVTRSILLDAQTGPHNTARFGFGS